MAAILETYEGASLTAFSNAGNWYRTTARAYNGTYSFRSAVIGHSQTSTHNFDITVPVGVIDARVSLYYYTSTELNWDWLRIYLNGVKVLEKSGTTGWTYWESGVLSEDTDNNLQLVYSKDGSGSVGEDTVYIDNLQLKYTDPSFAWFRTQGDTLSLADTITPNHTVGAPPTDGWDVYLWDNAKFDVILKKHTIGDTISLADALAIKVKDPNADTTTLADNVNKTIKNVLADTVGVADDLIKTIRDVTDEALSLTDDLRKTIKDITDDTLSLTDAIQAKAQLQIAEALSLLDALAAAIKTSFDDSVSVDDQGIPRLMVLFQEAVAVSDSILALFQAVFGDSLAVQDLLANRVQDQLGDDAVTSSDNIALSANPSLNDTVALADAITSAVAAYRSDILNLADQLAVTTKATQADILNLLDDIAAAVGKNDLDSATSLADDLANKVSPEAVAEALGLSDSQQLTAKPYAADNTTTADAIVARVQDYLDDLLTLVDSAKAKASDVNDDTAAPTDTLAIVTKRLLADTLSLADSIANGYQTGVLKPGTFDFGKFDESNYDDTGDPISLEDAIEFKKGFGTLGADLLALADAIQVAVKDVLADSLSVADSTSAAVDAKAGDTLTLADDTTEKTGKNDGDASTLTDNVGSALIMPRTAGDSSISLSDTSTVAVAKVATEEVGTGKPYTKSLQPSAGYPDTGGTEFTSPSADSSYAGTFGYTAANLGIADGAIGSVEIVVDLGTNYRINKVTATTGAAELTYRTDSLTVLTSNDGLTFTAFGSSSVFINTWTLEVVGEAVGRFVKYLFTKDFAPAGIPGDWLFINRGRIYGDDNVAIVTDMDEGKNIGPGPGDTTGVGDTASFSFKKDLDDLLILSDSLLRSVAAIVGDTLPVADQLTLAAKAVAAEIALSLADDNKLKAMTLLGDLMALSDDHIKDIAKTIDDVGTVNDALANRIGAILNSVTTLADTFALSVTLGIVDDIIGVADSIDNITRFILGSSFDMAAWDSAAFDTTGDLAAIADSISLLISLAIADGLTVDDDTKAAIKLQYNEAINLVDSILGLYAAALNSNLPLSDMIGLKNMKTLADTVALADILANKYEMAELQEAIDLVEDLILKAKVTGSEMVDLQDTIDMVAGFGTSIDDTVGLSDTSYIEARKQLADMLSLVNTLQTKAKLPIDEAIAAADILGVMTRRDAADTIDLMDEIARLYRYVLGVSWDSSSWDGGQFDTSGDSILVEDGYRFALSTLLQEAIATNDTLKTKVGITLADNSDIMDQILNGIMKSAAETMGMSDELLQLIVGLRKDTSLSLAELLSKRAGLPPDDSSTVADSIIAALLLARSADDLIAATDEAIAKVKSMLQDAAVLTDSLALSTKRGIAEAIATAEALGLKTKRPVSSNGVGIIDELYLKYALGIAWDEEGIADSIRGKVKTLLQQVFINGISIPVNGLNLRHSGKDRVSTATFKIPSPNAEILNLAKQRAPVNIYLVDGIGNTDYFGGRIIGNPTSARGSITTEMDITVDDWTSASLDVYVSESFTADSGTISEILKYLWEKYYGYSINLDKIVATTKRMPTQVFNYVSLFEVTERLAQLLGWSWHVEWNGAERILQFYPPSAAIHPVTLSRESKNIVAGTARFGQDDNLANVVYVFGGQGMSNPYTQKIVTDGQNTIYKLGSKPYRLGEGDDGGIQVNIIQGEVKAPLRVGIQNLHDEQLFDVMLDFNEGTLRFRENNIPIKDAILEAIYRFRYPIMVQLTDDSSIRQYGRIETSITDTSLLDVVAARELGRAILRDRAYPKGFGSCEVFVPGLRAGQFITVDLPAYNTKGLFEITEIEKWIQGGVVRRRVTLNKADNAESRIAQRLKEFAKRLASLETSNRQEDMVVQRWLQGPANIGTKVTGRVEGQIEESATDNIQLLQDDYVLTWKTPGRSKTWAKDSHPLSDDFAKKAKPKNNEVVPATSKITGGISFFDTHTFGDSSHPFGL
jgi:hypothetical protein